MILSLNKLTDYGITPYGVIHIGAHHGLEYSEYLEAGIVDMIFFEPVKSNYEGLLKTLPAMDSIKTFNIALGNESGQKKIFIEQANQGMSCSLLEPEHHLIMYPWITFNDFEVVDIEKLDNIEFNRSLYNILNIDVQGFELEVLKGASETLKTIDAIYTEVNKVEMYKGCALIGDIDNYLQGYGFRRLADNIEHNGRWGDALYIR